MKKILLGTLLLSLFNLANAAGNAASATMQVSFVVQESCTVQMPDSTKAAPAVSCAHAAPVQVAPAAFPAIAPHAAPSQALASADGTTWQIVF